MTNSDQKDWQAPTILPSVSEPTASGGNWEKQWSNAPAGELWTSDRDKAEHWAGGGQLYFRYVFYSNPTPELVTVKEVNT